MIKKLMCIMAAWFLYTVPMEEEKIVKISSQELEKDYSALLKKINVSKLEFEDAVKRMFNWNKYLDFGSILFPLLVISGGVVTESRWVIVTGECLLVALGGASLGVRYYMTNSLKKEIGERMNDICRLVEDN